MSFKDRDALYYPYVHVRNVEWLKRTLLVFPHVARMVPRGFEPRDLGDVRKFRELAGSRGEPLLRQANLDSSGVVEAQSALANKIRSSVEREPTFREKFGRDAARSGRATEDPGFQIYPDKISDSLFYCLEANGLAWEPGLPDHVGYRELHPKLGEAIMSTLAIACAKAEGLEIVTDENRRSLSHCLATRNLDTVYDSWLGAEQAAPEPRDAPRSSQLLEIIAYHHCDPSMLTAENLAKLSADREAIASLHGKLQELASQIPDDIGDDAYLKERLYDGASQALTQWRKDRANLSAFGKELLGSTSEDIGKILQDIATTAATPGPAATGTIVGGLTSGTLLGAAAGFAVGIVIHGVSSWRKIRQHETESPYRYLTMLEKAGVAFTVGR